MSDADRAAELARFQHFWLGRSTPAGFVSGGAPIAIPATPAALNTANWKGPAPTAEEKESMRDWNKF
jgi:hypothetical protein